MPKAYEPELDHKPLGWGSETRGEEDTEVERLVAALRSNEGAIKDAFLKSGIDLESDDLPELLVRLQLLLIQFVAECRAHPVRTARQILPTVVETKHDPPAFLSTMETYSPEAVALVYEMYQLIFPGKCDLEAFEWGRGPAPEAADIAIAADAAIALLEQEAKAQGRGRPKMGLVEGLAVALSKQFRGLGGSLGRTYHRGGLEQGAFLDFVEAIIGPARTLVALSGYSLTAATMVRQAQEALARDRS